MSKDRVTLDRVLSKLGLCSRSDAAESIRAGRVAVNGKIVRDPDHWVTLKEDQIKFAGHDLRTHKRVYLALNKPTGVVTTYRDPQGRSTIYDFIKELNAWVFPVGRLDKDTSGLLLLTNDTRLGETLTNPCSKVPKTYLVKINLHPSLEQLERLRSGITLKSGETTMPANIRVLRQSQKCTFLEDDHCGRKKPASPTNDRSHRWEGSETDQNSDWRTGTW